MTRSILAVFVAVAAISLAACNPSPPTPPTGSVSSMTPQPDVGTPPPIAAVPTPPPEVALKGGVMPTDTARDSKTPDPKGTLTAEEASKSMPMAGHGNNHSSPSLEPPKK